MKFLKPVAVNPSIRARIRVKLNKFFFEEIFSKLLPSKVENIVLYGLSKALSEGKVYYSNGYFRGNFNAEISKAILDLGGSYNKNAKAYRFNLEDLPIQLLEILERHEEEYMKYAEELETKFNKFKPNKMIKKLDVKEEMKQLANHTDQSIIDTLPRSIDLGIEIALDERQNERIAKEYTNNMELWIKDFVEEQISNMRKQVKAEVLSGTRSENLVNIIKERENISYKKAKFIAKQETNLLTGKIREVRYNKLGLKKYKWKTTGRVTVRHDHKLLDNTVQEWSKPPITNKKTGDRNNPSEDWGCQCIAIPIIE